MNHTPQIRKAIQFAARKHHGQMRADREPLPYITHLFSVALLVAEDGADDDTVSAALLHDTIEDTGTSRAELVEAFNERVADLVEAVTEVKMENGQKVPWKDRKLRYLATVEAADDEALLIATADKIDNIESALDELARGNEEVFKTLGHSFEEYAWYHGEALRIAEARLPAHRLTRRLRESYERELAAMRERA